MTNCTLSLQPFFGLNPHRCGQFADCTPARRVSQQTVPPQGVVSQQKAKTLNPHRCGQFADCTPARRVSQQTVPPQGVVSQQKDKDYRLNCTSSTPSTSTTHRRLKHHPHYQRLNTTPLTKGSTTSSPTTRTHLQRQLNSIYINKNVESPSKTQSIPSSTRTV